MTKSPIGVREYIGRNDADGHPIHLGDIVEFWHCECERHPEPSGLTTPTKQCYAQVRSVDYVYKARHEGKIAYYFCQAAPPPGQEGGAFAWRYARGCRVLGRLPHDARLIVDALPMIPAGVDREHLVAQVKRFKLEHSNV